MAEANPGALTGLVKSKKYGLVFAFVTTCFAFVTQTTQPVLQIVLVGCAAASVMTYVACQSLLEARPGEAPPEDDAPAQNSGASTVTIGSSVSK